MILDSKPRAPAMGWPLLPFPDEHGELAYPAVLAESVRQQLQVILSTRPGEQLMRPGFGAGLTEFLGEPDTITTRRRIYDRVSELVARIPAHTPEWTNPRPGDPGRSLIELFAWLGDALLYRVNLIPER